MPPSPQGGEGPCSTLPRSTFLPAGSQRREADRATSRETKEPDTPRTRIIEAKSRPRKWCPARPCGQSAMRKHRERHCLHTAGRQGRTLRTPETASGWSSTEPEFPSKGLGFIWVVMPRSCMDAASTWKMNVTTMVKRNDLTAPFITNKPMCTQVTVGKAMMTSTRDGLLPASPRP